MNNKDIALCTDCGMHTTNPNHNDGKTLIYEGSIITKDDEELWNRYEAMGETV